MKSSDIYSKDWCDIVFDGRNKDYGAYRIRSRTGRRYAYALLTVLTAFFAFVFAVGGFFLYNYIKARRDMENADDIFAKKPADLKDGYELKFIATARLAPRERTKRGAKAAAPEIVDGTPPLEYIGKDGPVDFDPEQQIITTPIVDTTGLHDETLPVAIQKIVPTEKVQQLPAFPGGLRAFMKWLDENIAYPEACLRRKEQGMVTLTFIVDEEGRTTDVEVKNSFDRRIVQCITEAMKRVPKWTPGTDEAGRRTQVRITVPVEFKI